MGETRMKRTEDGFAFNIIIQQPCIIAVMSGKRASRFKIKGIARCNMDADKFDVEYGIQIAILRALAKYHRTLSNQAWKQINAASQAHDFHENTRSIYRAKEDELLKKTDFIKDK